jgi:hypothetical protein
MICDTQRYLNDPNSSAWARLRNARPGVRARLWQELVASHRGLHAAARIGERRFFAAVSI